MANTIKAWAWICQECQRECVPIRAESRCMCGHRLKQHTQGQRCSLPSCSCPKFSFIVAEGSWILRCRCKHKHTEHDPASHACSKAACSCSGFSSPWVCNCNHPWSQHQQVLVERQVLRLSDMIGQAQHAGSSSSICEPPPREATLEAAAAGAAAAAAARGVTTSLQDLNISSNSQADVASSSSSSSSAAAAAAAAGIGAGEAVCESNDVAATGASSHSIHGGGLSCSTPQLQQGSEPLLAEDDFTCEVNRWDLVQRGMGKK